MAESLDNAEVIGGVVVEVGVNVDRLRAAPAQVKQIAQQIEQTPITVRIVPDVSRLNVATTQLQALSRQAQQVVNSVQVTISPSVNGQLAQQQLTALMRQLQSQANSFGLQIQAQLGLTAVGNGPLTTAISGLQNAAGSLQNAANSLSRTTGSIGGGGGGGAGSSGGGGGAGVNPFSLRGLGRVAGSIAAVYAIDESVKLATGFLEADQIRHSGPSILRSNDRLDSSYQASLDPLQRELANKLAFEKADLKQIQTIESIPVIGTVAGLIDAATGSSARDIRYIERVTKRMQAQQIAVEGGQENQIRLAEASGDKVLAARLGQQRNVAAAQSVLDANPDSKDAQAFWKSAFDLGKIQIDRAIFEQFADLKAISTRLQVARGDSTIIAADRSGNQREALIAQQANTIAKLEADQAAELSRYVDTPKYQQVRDAQADELRNQKDRNAADLIALDKRVQAERTSIENQGAEARIRISQGEYAAKKFMLEQSAYQAIAAVKPADLVRVSIAETSKLYAEFADHARELKDNIASQQAIIREAQFTIDRDPQGAALVRYRDDTRRQLANVAQQYGDNSPEYKNTSQARAAGEKALIAEQQRSNAAATAMIDARIAANSLRVQGKSEQAGLLERNAGLIASITAASPELRAKTTEGVLSELETERYQLNRDSASVTVSAGDFALGPGSTRIADSLAQINDDSDKAKKAGTPLPPTKLPGGSGGLWPYFGNILKNIVQPTGNYRLVTSNQKVASPDQQFLSPGEQQFFAAYPPERSLPTQRGFARSSALSGAGSNSESLLSQLVALVQKISDAASDSGSASKYQ